MRKIQFGSGGNKLDGWDNTDLPTTDVRNTLDFENNSVDFIFHEHLIEHLDEVDGYNFLKECYRILKDDGVMRISCPSIDGFIKVYLNWDNTSDEFKKRYINKTRFINDVTFGESMNYDGKRFDTNGDITSRKNSSKWHKYLYDKEDFINKLTKIGFKEIKFVNKHESSYSELQKLERRFNWKLSFFPEEMDITLEAKK